MNMTMNKVSVEWMLRPAIPVEEEAGASVNALPSDESARLEEDADVERWDGLS